MMKYFFAGVLLVAGCYLLTIVVTHTPPTYKDFSTSYNAANAYAEGLIPQGAILVDISKPKADYLYNVYNMYVLYDYYGQCILLKTGSSNNSMVNVRCPTKEEILIRAFATDQSRLEEDPL